MTLSNYHQKYAAKSDADLKQRIEEKKQELIKIFEQVELKKSGKTVRVAVLGCADKRLVKGHKKIFADILKKPVELYTFDISIEHLAGEENIIQHDCTLPLPNAPFDIAYSHVLLKFIPTEKQFDLLKNSVLALAPGGLAIHIMDKEDYETVDKKLPDGSWAVPLEKWEEELAGININYLEIPVRYGLALILSK
jgi:hypothetical protein